MISGACDLSHVLFGCVLKLGGLQKVFLYKKTEAWWSCSFPISRHTHVASQDSRIFVHCPLWSRQGQYQTHQNQDSARTRRQLLIPTKTACIRHMQDSRARSETVCLREFARRLTDLRNEIVPATGLLQCPYIYNYQ